MREYDWLARENWEEKDSLRENFLSTHLSALSSVDSDIGEGGEGDLLEPSFVLAHLVQVRVLVSTTEPADCPIKGTLLVLGSPE